MVVCVGSELVYTVTAFYDVGSTWVDLVKKKTFLTSLKSAFFFFKTSVDTFRPIFNLKILL